MIRVLVVDDHVIVRNGLEQLLGTAPDIELVATASDGLSGVTAVELHRPDVVLMDLSMPQMDGIEATRRISSLCPDTKVLVLSSFSEQRRVIDALAAGADGYLLKHSEPDHIVGAIRAVHNGGSPLDPIVARVLLDSHRAGGTPGELSAREREVLVLVREGLANKQIARRLGISERTVKAHLTRVFQRIGVTDRTQAALWAAEHL